MKAGAVRKRCGEPLYVAYLLAGLAWMAVSPGWAADVQPVRAPNSGVPDAPLSAQELGEVSGAGLAQQAITAGAPPPRVAVILWDEAGKRSLPRVADSAQWALTPGGLRVDMSKVP